ncbi:MAG: hypothetical protein ABJA10_09570 [Aestuariivirga sp.]
MDIIKDVLAELFNMFVTDARLTVATLLLVALAAILIIVFPVEPLISGGVLLIGCFAIVIEATVRETKARAKR